MDASADERQSAFRRLRPGEGDAGYDVICRAVVYTHSHYVHGTRALLEDAAEPVRIIAHPRLDANVGQSASPLAGVLAQRHRAQYGQDLPDAGPDAPTARPAHHHGESGYVPPTESPDHDAGRRLLASALRGIAQVTTAWSTRNYCLTQARRIEADILP
jgi:hypothetical protein